MDPPKASYSITLKANVLEVTRAGYDTRKRRATPRGRRASARWWEPRSVRRKDTTVLLTEATSAASLEASSAGSSEASPVGSQQAGWPECRRIGLMTASRPPLAEWLNGK